MLSSESSSTPQYKLDTRATLAGCGEAGACGAGAGPSGPAEGDSHWALPTRLARRGVTVASGGCSLLLLGGFELDFSRSQRIDLWVLLVTLGHYLGGLALHFQYAPLRLYRLWGRVLSRVDHIKSGLPNYASKRGARFRFWLLFLFQYFTS